MVDGLGSDGTVAGRDRSVLAEPRLPSDRRSSSRSARRSNFSHWALCRFSPGVSNGENLAAHSRAFSNCSCVALYSLFVRPAECCEVLRSPHRVPGIATVDSSSSSKRPASVAAAYIRLSRSHRRQSVRPGPP